MRGHGFARIGESRGERLKKLAKGLETLEAQIQLVEEDIKKLESAVEEGTDGEDE